MEFAFNNQEHSATHHSPFFLMYGSHPIALPMQFVKSKVPSIQEWLRKRQRAQEEAGAALEYATAQMATHVCRHSQPFKEGQKVWLEITHCDDGYPFRKLDAKRHGPFKIAKVLSKLMYKLALPKTMKIHLVVHASLLSPYHETP
ncbi:hypothetical protein PsYK624_172280 [Phanerochaete sordida]|uniref:Tf2-1-like SH3-like domain-containing protein n=1 Tax=Phanerochaete sordida TaxID=48140 RepID=A0A9P3GSB9_9APHY|nr:hypothetical protein PsYK624_172280 [Phanerochaete sordida]